MTAVARILWNEDYLREYWVNYLRFVRRGRMRTTANLCLLVLTMTAWFLFVKSGMLLLILEVGTLLVAALFWYSERRSESAFVAAIRKSPIYGQISELVFEEDRIGICELSNRSECKWEACQKIIVLPAGMLVFLSGVVFYIPDDSLSPKDAKAGIIERRKKRSKIEIKSS